MTETPLETPDEAGTGKDGLVKYWKLEFDLHGKGERNEKKWRKTGDRVLMRYREEDKQRSANSRFNALWANTETLKPSVYSRPPVPEVRRRYSQADELGREAAQTIERALAYTIDADDEGEGYDWVMEACRDDMLLPGRGVCRVHVHSEMVEMTPEIQPGVTGIDGGPVFTAGGQQVLPEFDEETGLIPQPIEDIGHQRIEYEYVFWKDFRRFPANARRWPDVYAVAYRHMLTRDELVDRFGEKGKDVAVTHDTHFDDDDKQDDAQRQALKRAEVWEIWDTRTREVLHIAFSEDEPIEVVDDPKGLENFFDCPPPLYAITTTDTLVPRPEYAIYEDQANELDRLTSRIDKLIGALKVRGAYAGDEKEALTNILASTSEDLTLIPVPDWQAFQGAGGLDGMISWVPVEQVGKVLTGLYTQREQVLRMIQEITGIADITRGSTNPNETAAAQNLKSQFASARMTPRTKPMQRFARGTLRLAADLIAKHFTKQNLERVTNGKVSDEVFQLLRDDEVRGFRIDIETDSTIAPDEQRQKQNATEFMSAVTEYFTGITPIVQAAPQTVPMFMELLKQGTRAFKFGRAMEDAIEQAAEQLTQQAQQQQQPQTDPAAEQAKAEAEAAQQAAQADAQLKAQSAQADTARKDQTAQADIERKAQSAEADAVIKASRTTGG